MKNSTVGVSNGSNVTSEDYPWHVSIYWYGHKQFRGNGILLSQRVILTGKTRNPCRKFIRLQKF